jgi:nicotinic acid mononucleotide adenylyltransferase
MLNILLKNLQLPNIRICNFEEDENFEGKVYLLLNYIKEKHPAIDFYFIVGKQALNNIHKWYEYEKFIEENYFYLVSRKGMRANQENLNLICSNSKDTIIAATYCTPDISSETVKELLKKEESEEKNLKLKELLQPDILEYILDYKLYNNETKIDD